MKKVLFVAEKFKFYRNISSIRKIHLNLFVIANCFLWLITSLPNTSFATDIKNSACISITGSACITVCGNYTNETSDGNHGKISNDGNIKISGNWNNNSTDVSNCVFINLNNNGTVEFNGTSLQTIGGCGASTFENLTINNSSGLTLSADINVNYTLLMNAGDFDLRNNNLNLGLTGYVNGETSAKRLKSTDGILDGYGTGYVLTTKTIGVGAYNNIAGLGININAATDFGSTIIKRGHKRQQGTDAYSSNYSIFRYYEILPSGKTSNYGTVTINYFPAFELNGHTDGQLVIYQLIQSGTPVYWTPLSTTNTSPQAVATTLTNSLSYIKLTIGSNNIPLPIELVNFKASCLNQLKSSKDESDSVPVLVEWKTESEINNVFFQLEKSNDLQHWNLVQLVEGAGNSHVPLFYSITDKLKRDGLSYYYRLGHVNYDGEIQYSNTIEIVCNNTLEGEIYLYPNPAKNYVRFNILTPEAAEINISIFGPLGQKLICVKQVVEKGLTELDLDVSSLCNAIYFVRVELNNETIFEKTKLIIDK